MTDLARHLSDDQLQALVDTLDAAAKDDETPFQLKTIPQGAATSIWAGVVANADAVGGRYCEDCHVTTFVTDAPLSSAAGGVRPYALDPVRAQALWALSEAMVGERF